MRKYLTRNFLSDLGWSGVDVGKYVVSYCETCGQQRLHTCTGKKEDNGQILLRLECSHCRERLNGGLN
jgi:hypothetical protein